MDKTYEPLHSDKWSFVQWNIMDIPTRIIWIFFSFNEALKYGDGAKF
jgi:hypothetical protein